VSDALVRTRGLTIEYGRRRSRHLAVDGVDLDVAAGETVGLVGESGSGKSSLGNALLGLVPTTGGSITFDGMDITRAGRAERRRLARRMQVVFQDPFGSLNPVRTVGDTLSEALRYNLGLSRAASTERLESALGDVGLEPSALHRYPAQFSGGQRQRIAIARAIAVDPEFIVCDEAVSALDLSVQAQVLNVFARLRRDRGLAYLFISHDLSVVRFLSDRIAVLYAGRVVEEGPAALVSDAPAHPYTRMLVTAAPVPDPTVQAQRRRDRRPEAGRAEPPGEDACVFAARCPFAIDVCRVERPELRDRADGRRVACHRYDDLDLLENT
jgi:oligopeptide/dipeptide ABC transporter ATP-binding protein